MDITTLTLALAFFIGLFSGVLSGVFGLGGATINIPLLRILLRMPGQMVIGTALPLTIPAALTGAIIYQRKGLIKYKTVITVGIVGAIASVFGAYMTQYVSSEAIMTIMGALLIFLAYITYKQKKVEKSARIITLKEKVLKNVFIGCIAGFFAGFLGIGGGIILVPLLAKIRNIPYRKAVASSLAIMVVYAIPAVATHWTLGHVNLPILLVMFVGAIMGAWYGANTAITAKTGDIMKWFTVLLAVLGTMLLANELLISLGFVESNGIIWEPA